VYERDPQNIIGILHYKDLFPLWYRIRTAARLNAPLPQLLLRALLHKPVWFPRASRLAR